MDSGEVFNAQRKPPEWDSLLDCVESATNPLQPIELQQQAARAAINAVIALDTDQAKANRSYGAGLYICDFARTLYTPEGMRSFTSQAIHEVVNQRPLSTLSLPPSSGLLLDEVSSTKPPKNRPYLETPPQPMPVRILSNAFGELLQYHGNERPVDSYVPKVLTSNSGRYAQSTARDGAGMVLGTVLTQRYNVQRGQERNELIPYDTLLKDVITPEQLEHLDLTKLNTILAGMRLSDVYGYMPRIIQVQPDGEVEIDHTHVPKKGNLQTSLTHVGQNLVRCPALYVQGLIPFISSLTPKVIASAQRQLLAQA
jgi:hypothetical protein